MSWRVCVAPRKKLNKRSALWNPRQIESFLHDFFMCVIMGIHLGRLIVAVCGLRADSVVEKTRALRWYKVARSVLSSGNCQVSFGIVVFWDPSGNVLVAWGDGGSSFFGLAVRPAPALNYPCPQCGGASSPRQFSVHLLMNVRRCNQVPWTEMSFFYKKKHFH